MAILIVIDDRRILRPCAAAFQDLRSWGHAAAEKEGPESGTSRTYLFLGFFHVSWDASVSFAAQFL